MQRSTFIWIGALALVAVAFLAQAGAEDGAKQAMKEGAKLIDVRTPAEFAEGHLPGAVNIPVDELASRMQEVGAKSERVVVYCRSGKRSARAKGMLEGAGFAKAFDLGAMRNGE